MKKTNTLFLSALATGLVLSTATYAAPYNWELEGGYKTADTDIDDIDVNEDNISFNATYYFQSVDPVRSLHEAAFLGRASSISLGVDIEELDDDIRDAVDADTYRVNGVLVHPETGWYGKLGYIDSESDFESPGMPGASVVNYSPEFDGYSGAVGKYIFENTTLQLEYTYTDVKGDYFIQGGRGSDTDVVGLRFKHYGAITEGIAYSFEAGYYFVDLEIADFDRLDDDPFDNSGEVYDLAFTVYPMRELAVGLAYTDADHAMGTPYSTTSPLVQDGIGLFGEWYFTENFSLRAVYNNESYDIANPDDIEEPGEVDGDSLLFAAKFRF